MSEPRKRPWYPHVHLPAARWALIVRALHETGRVADKSLAWYIEGQIEQLEADRVKSGASGE